MSSDQKELRKQLRNVVRGLLPETLTRELQDKITRTLQDAMTVRLNAIQKDIVAHLENMNSRSKDVQDFIMRQALASQTQAPTQAQEANNVEGKEETTSEAS